MTTDYHQEIAAFRAAADQALRAADGWLTVVGLAWLHEGRNTIGAGENNDIVLPAESAPEHVGRIVFDGERAVFHPAPDVAVQINGKPAEPRALRPDVPGPADRVSVGTVTCFLIRRGARLGVRVRDSNSAARRNFGGRRWYPVRPEYRVEAVYTPYEPARAVAITNILGDTETMNAVGLAAFSLGGRQVHLEALARQDGLWFIFRDATSGVTTYPAARFLYAPAPENGRVTLDFNRAVSPPCAFTEHATCPLPPPQNRLGIALEAGELYAGV